MKNVIMKNDGSENSLANARALAPATLEPEITSDVMAG
jgi:hypothetical protein